MGHLPRIKNKMGQGVCARGLLACGSILIEKSANLQVAEMNGQDIVILMETSLTLIKMESIDTGPRGSK